MIPRADFVPGYLKTYEEGRLREKVDEAVELLRSCHVFPRNGEGTEVTAPQLAAVMLRRQSLGCHSINFVTPEHVVPQILEALLLATEAGLRLSLVYNTSSYDSLDSIRLMEGVVDIYMPDFKLWDSQHSLRFEQALA